MKIYSTLIVIISLILLSTIFYSCEKNASADVPAYIYVDSIGLSTNNFTQGFGSHNITDLWVYIDEKPIGVFNKNKLIPIVAKDYSNINIKIYAGIRSNGLKNNIEIYFLYKNIELNKSIRQGQIDTINPIFHYDDFTKFVFIEDFENGNIFNKDNDGNPNTQIIVTSENVIYGNKCGVIYLDKDNNKIEVTTKEDFYELPKGGNKVFFELDYTCDTEFIIGISGKDKLLNEYKEDLIFLKKKDSWNKLYLDLTYPIKKAELESYKIYFKVVNPTDSIRSRVYLDNLKLLYLNR